MYTNTLQTKVAVSLFSVFDIRSRTELACKRKAITANGNHNYLSISALFLVKQNEGNGKGFF